MNNASKPRLYPFYLFSGFAYLLPLYAVYILMVNKAVGDPFKTAFLIAAWSATVVLLEVPSGALADLWSRKKMITSAQLANLGSCLIWFLAKDFWLLLLAFVLWGVSESFTSGAFQALLYEELEEKGKEELYEKASGRCMFLMTAGVALAMLIGGALKEHNIKIVYILSIFSASIAALITLILPPDKQRVDPYQKYHHLLRNAFHQIKKSSTLIRLLIYCVLYLALIGTIEEFLQLWLAELNIKGFLFGGILSIIMLLQAAGAAVGSFFILGNKKERFLYLGMAISGILLITGRLFLPLSLPAMALVFFTTGLMETKLESAAQEEINGQRATLLSINSFSMNLAAILFALAIGSISKNSSFATSFALCGGLLVVGTIYLWVNKSRI